jgi:hypothetical protein
MAELEDLVDDNRDYSLDDDDDGEEAGAVRLHSQSSLVSSFFVLFVLTNSCDANKFILCASARRRKHWIRPIETSRLDDCYVCVA